MVGPAPFSSSWTEAGRTLATRIIAHDEDGSLKRLLAVPVDDKLQMPNLKELRTNSAQGRLIMSALWDLGPRSPLTGEKYALRDLTDAIQPEGTLADIAKHIFSKEKEGRRLWAANRMIVLEEELPEPLTKLITSKQSLLLGSEIDFFASHGLSIHAIENLSNGHRLEFLESRQENLDKVVRDFLQRMAGTELEDTPSLASLNFDDSEEGDDEIIE